jgi:hypothetical protein
MIDQIANWAIMVYISADKDLANFAVESLKQLKRGAGNGIVVLAQVETNGIRDVRRYRFDGSEDRNSSIEDNRVVPIFPAPSAGGIADPANLTEFIVWATESPDGAAAHRCLFLWGHGSELLLDESLATKHNGLNRDYLTSKNLREALKNAQLRLQGRKLDIIGIDACSMSQIEVASELQDCGKFMIASQEDVPDASFPYESLLFQLKVQDPEDVERIAAAIPRLYKQAYQDYVVVPETGMREITLTSVSLASTRTITDPLKQLATALQSSAVDPDLRKAVIKARRSTRDFALGLFVDLFDFCVQLRGQIADGELKVACKRVCDNIEARGKDSCVIENQTGDDQENRCNGLSIYFPYLDDAEIELEQKSLVAGQTLLAQQLPLMVKGGTNHLLKTRSGRIAEMEADFEALLEFKQTGWIDFIRQGWSVTLAAEEPNKLEQHYSAEQCAINLLALAQGSNRRLPDDRKPTVEAEFAAADLLSRSAYVGSSVR